MHRRALIAGLSATLVSNPSHGTISKLPDVDAAFTISDAVPKSLYPLLDEWVEKSASAVRGYYGKFPVPVLDLHISARDGDGIGGGRSEPGVRPTILVGVGTSSSADDLLVKDWVLVHEMIHLAIPYVPRRHFWLAEGLAVYVESIARIQVGHVDAASAWRDFMVQMPRGLPKQGEGLAQSRDHGRVYWGGALFCLVADIRIRKETGNKAGLQTALRGINATMDFRQEMDVVPVLVEGDKSTGTKVLQSLYDEMAMAGGAPDMAVMWSELGVVANGKRVDFDDAAPLAEIRRAINAPA